MKTKYRFILIALLSAAGIAIVALLHDVSENIIAHHNTFIRRFPLRTTEVASVDLGYNSYYFAGGSDSILYLGNTTAPTLITSFDTELRGKRESRIIVDPGSFQFNSIQVQIRGNEFYLVDGTVPAIFGGSINDWNAGLLYNGDYRFSRFEIADSRSLNCVTDISGSDESILANLYFQDNPQIHLKPNALTKQIDGVFDVDGTLMRDPITGNIIFLYLYRNEFIVADQSLDVLYKSNTIDTISRAKIKVALVKNRNEKKLAKPPLVVNPYGTAYGNLLFVHSALPGRFEALEVWRQASIIDVYDLNTKAYLSSFYIYHIDEKRLRSFFVIDEFFYAFIGNHLVSYKLSDGITSRYKL